MADKCIIQLVWSPAARLSNKSIRVGFEEYRCVCCCVSMQLCMCVCLCVCVCVCYWVLPSHVCVLVVPDLRGEAHGHSARSDEGPFTN